MFTPERDRRPVKREDTAQDAWMDKCDRYCAECARLKLKSDAGLEALREFSDHGILERLEAAAGALSVDIERIA